MSFGDDLLHEFREEQKIDKDRNEVALFRCLNHALVNIKRYHKNYTIAELHGKKGEVAYYNTVSLSRISGEVNKSNCEMSDLVFIVYSKYKKECRLTYMQNKLEVRFIKKRKPTFFLDSVQLGLLKGRPKIEISGSRKKLPAMVVHQRILKDALLASVGSYGVFYNIKASNDIYDMFYCSANIIDYINPLLGRRKHIAVKWNSSNKIQTICGYNERQYAMEIKEFGDALVSLEIGTPLNELYISLFQKAIANSMDGKVDFCKINSKELVQSDRVGKLDESDENRVIEKEIDMDKVFIAAKSVFIIDADSIKSNIIR